MVLNISFCLTDVRDVANAHIIAMENNRLSGRFILCHKAMHLASILQVIHENFTDIRVPSRKVKIRTFGASAEVLMVLLSCSGDGLRCEALDSIGHHLQGGVRQTQRR